MSSLSSSAPLDIVLLNRTQSDGTVFCRCRYIFSATFLLVIDRVPSGHFGTILSSDHSNGTFNVTVACDSTSRHLGGTVHDVCA
jgi:hypothetical protein